MIRVLQLSTHNEPDGIAKYQEQFLDNMKSEKDIDYEFFEVSPNVSRFMPVAEFRGVLKKFETKMLGFDILHIQHELSYYKHKELESVIGIAHQQGKKVIVTIHTALAVEYPHRVPRGLNPRSILHNARAIRQLKHYEKVHLTPLRSADLIIVHNKNTKNSLITYGFDDDKITVIHMPVPRLGFDEVSNEITKALKHQKGDIIYAAAGFISKTKGTDHAVKALSLLPENYKLAIIGGIHPKANNEAYLDEIYDYVVDHNLQDRVYVTGYVESDDRLNALIRECDICVYPYDKEYYAYVSSASMSNAFANHKAVIAYQTASLIELNNDGIDVVTFCKSPNYSELAREIQTIDVGVMSRRSEQYAKLYAYDTEAKKFAEIYRSLATSAH